MKLKKKLNIIFISVAILLMSVGCSNKEDIIELNISAAASLKEVVEELEVEYKKENENIDLLVNFGGSGSLQRQIEQGAPCDIFISAGIDQMNNLKESGYLLNDTYEDLVKNELVLIANKDSKIKTMDDLLTDNVEHIGVGQPESVPAGKYADEVLNNLNIKESVSEKLVFAKDVKEVLAWTKSKNAEVGFVYYTDAINTEGIKIIEKAPKDSYSQIAYPIAIIKASKNINESKRFEEFLLSEKAQTIFEKYGYEGIK